jgi:hypothetical protein
MRGEIDQRIDRYLTARRRLDTLERELAAAETEALTDADLADDDDEDYDEDGAAVEPLSDAELTALLALADADHDDEEDVPEPSLASLHSELQHATEDLHGALQGKPRLVRRGYRQGDAVLIPRGDGSIEMVEVER